MEPVPFRDAVRVWLRIALQSFGGPAGQISVMHRILVDEKKWLSEKRFLHALNYCMLLPGPEAMQLATYSGWLLHGVRGGLVAGCLFVLPGFLSILGLSIAYVLYAETSWLAAAFFGLKAAVLALVVQAAWRLGSRALRSALALGLAVGAFVAIFVFGVPFPLIILAAGLVAWRFGPRVALDEDAPPPTGWRASLRTAAVWSMIWWLPVGALALILGLGHVLVQQAWFFSKAAVVTFGGAYAVLAYIAQQAVETHGWLQPGEMLDGLGLAESTPGPLIQVVQFVGFLGAYREAAPFSPLVAATLASIIVTWVTFAPSFLFIFTGAPHIEWLRSRAGLSRALGGITAAVVGVIVNLAVWFGLHVLWPAAQERSWGPVSVLVPQGSVDWLALAVAAAAFVALWRKANVFVVLGAAVVVGLLLR